MQLEAIINIWTIWIENFTKLFLFGICRFDFLFIRLFVCHFEN